MTKKCAVNGCPGCQLVNDCMCPAEGMYGQKLVDTAAALANREEPKISIETFKVIAKHVLYECEHFDGEPTAPGWFAKQLIKHSGRIMATPYLS